MFRTEIKLPVSTLQITHKTNIVTAGSCFSNVIGTLLRDNKFPTTINPFGIIYNPVSLFRLLNQATLNQSPTEDLLLERDGIWYHFDLHSEIWESSKEALVKRISSITQMASNTIQNADLVTITPGTSFVYELTGQEHIVANCHKLPAKNFNKKLLDPSAILSAFDQFYSNLKKINPKVKTLFTISPVRHIKDTMELNSVSKSILRYAIYEITKSYSDVYYFPSYEIMMDDLRDYRFYKEDMIHPDPVAEKYIWEKFKETYMSEKTRKLIKDWEKVVRAIHHKPFHPDSVAHKKFLNETLQKIKGFKQEFDVSEELETIRKKIS
ncbi:GSCFA domain-containing protein [Cytophagaceae bacterium ABcell3]|nr:GSCFA domain-containing protein [Cytophagaceae bacterium ABcell3]